MAIAGATLINTSMTVMMTIINVEAAFMLGLILLLMVYTMMLKFFTPPPVTK
jgi:hypothetical protein